MKLIAALMAMLDRDTFLKYAHSLFKLKNMENAHKSILYSIKKYFDEHKDRQSISIDELQVFFDLQNPTVKDRQAIDKVFKDLREVDITNDDLVEDLLNYYVEQQIASDIFELSGNIFDGTSKGGLDKIAAKLDAYKDITDGIQDIDAAACMTPFSEILLKETEGGYEWPKFLSTLNKNLGKIKRGQLGHIYARPNVGKSSMSIFISCGVAYRQHGLKEPDTILYLNNEESIERIKLRALTCMVQKSTGDLLDKATLKWAAEEWENRNGTSIKFIGNVMHISQVEKYIRHYSPGLVIIDQGPKVALYDRDLTDVQRLQHLYNKYREYAKIYDCAIITTGQADKKADNTKLLSLKHIDGSKVGVPGELDWAIGLGMLDDDPEYQRYYNVTKNKGPQGNGVLTFDLNLCQWRDKG